MFQVTRWRFLVNAAKRKAKNEILAIASSGFPVELPEEIFTHPKNYPCSLAKKWPGINDLAQGWWA